MKDIAAQRVATNLEKFPPGLIGILSESQWEDVVQARVKQKKMRPKRIEVHQVAPKLKDDASATTTAKDNDDNKPGDKKPTIALEGRPGKQLLPAVSEKVLLPIESHHNNVHLAKSKVADELLWKHIVKYSFSGMNRPDSLEFPVTVLKEKLQDWSDQLLEMVKCPDSNKNSIQLQMDSNRHTHQLQYILKSLMHVPMDVIFLATMDIGKSATKAAKAMRKLYLKQIKNDHDDPEALLLGYPRFWKPICWDNHDKFQCNKLKKMGEINDMAYLELLQSILQDWKDMAARQGAVETTSKTTAPPNNKKRKLVNGGVSSTFATCGKDKRVSTHQHQTDMELLHSSPDWRSLYQSLLKRQEMIKKSQGDRVRTTRENLEKGRPKVGKVVLKKAVGRVRGGDTDCNNCNMSKEFLNIDSSTGQSLNGPSVSTVKALRMEKREAILSKSLGNRSRQQQLAKNDAASNGKLSQLRNESKVAAAWSKSSFGSSVARAGGDTNRRVKMVRAQVQINLKNGKSMKLPSASAVGVTKSKGFVSSLQQNKGAQQGVFSSLEQKKKMEQVGRFNAKRKR